MEPTHAYANGVEHQVVATHPAKKNITQNKLQSTTHQYSTKQNALQFINQKEKKSAFQYHISQAIMLWKQSFPQILRRLKIPQDPNKKRCASFVLI